MTNHTTSFRRSTPIERNDGTPVKAERKTERRSVKASASAVLQRNAARNASGTVENGSQEAFHGEVPFHRSVSLEWNDGTPEIWGPFTPYVPTRQAGDWLTMIHELDSLIEAYVCVHKLDGSALARITDARRRQPLSTIPQTITWLKRELVQSNPATRPTQPDVSGHSKEKQ